MELPPSDVRFLLLSAAWAGLRSSEVLDVESADRDRRAQLADAARGVAGAAARCASADANLARAAARLAALLAPGVRAGAKPGDAHWEHEAAQFLAAQLSSTRAHPEERTIALQSAHECVGRMRAYGGALAGRSVLHAALSSIRSLRSAVESQGGLLEYRALLLLHQAAQLTFSTENVARNAVVARTAVLCSHGEVPFDTVVALLDALEQFSP